MHIEEPSLACFARFQYCQKNTPLMHGISWWIWCYRMVNTLPIKTTGRVKLVIIFGLSCNKKRELKKFSPHHNH